MRSLVMLAALFGAGAYGAERATADLRTRDGRPIGTVTLVQYPEGVLVKADLFGAPPGVHAFHVHERGRCQGNFESAGGHFNPEGEKHGLGGGEGMHAGDLPNLHVPASGRLKVDLFAPRLTLGPGEGSVLDRDGAAIVLHAGPDDYRTDPAGGAGDRLACGVIRASVQ